MKLYYCVLWRSFFGKPTTTKFIYANSVRELVDEFLEMGYVSMSITDVTDKEVDSFEPM
jgi:hypothetical protein